ncbi:MAG TPA: hypothetical protein VGG78_10760 [Gemmatimonadaceae bacterium]
MSHLSIDRLAALGDEQPTSAEAVHLASCEPCARELGAFRTLVAMAQAERTAIGLPLTRWESIADAMAREASPRRAARWPMQAAAGLLLLAGGAMLGRTSAGAPPLPGDTSPPVRSASASTPTPLPQDTAFTSLDDARRAQLQSEATYQRAAAFLAQYDTAAPAEGSPVAYRSRLAALDRVISASREAMRDAPHDPVINGYYLTTISQREATLRQLNTALPASLRLNSF